MSDTISKENTTVKNKHQVTASTEDKNKEDNDESQAVIVPRKKRDRMKSKAKTKSENSAVREQELTMVMNIGDPLAKLQELIEENVGYSLGKTVFSLQDSEELDRKSSLVELCVEGEGMVQVNCELKEMPNGLTKVNIVDILKPAEDIVEVAEDEIGELQANGKNLRWVVDQAFKNHLLSQNTPQDPGDWSIEETREWLMWAVMEFGLEGVDVKSWDKDGASLLGLSVDELRALIPVTNLLFWSHIEILRTCRVVAVPQRSDPDSLSEGSISEPELTGEVIGEPGEQQSTELQAASKSSGAVQLWKFLLELLTDFNHRDCIQWLEAEGEFKFTNPELVAQLWGIRKRKPNMNYDKLSRAMRYYYDGEMIQKVSGKRFVYKFICDLKQLVGYTSQELNSRVILAELEKKAALRKKGPDLSAPIQINDFLALIP